MREMIREFFKPYINGRKLNVGCGSEILEGWTNSDLSGGDVKFNMLDNWPFKDDSFDTIYASHTLEHFSGEELFDVMYEAGRVLSDGGHLLGVTPHGFTTLQLATPLHKQIWTEHTPGEFSSKRFSGHLSGMEQEMRRQPWEVVAKGFIFADCWKDKSKEELNFALRHYLNVAQELLFAMRIDK